MIMNQALMIRPSSRKPAVPVRLRSALVCALLFTVSLPALGRDLSFANGLQVHNAKIYLASATRHRAHAVAVRRPGKNFDHLLTGFPLFGAHTRVPCGTCHINGVLKGTPTQCVQCHGAPGMRAATYKPANHVQTQLPCDQCHNQTLWSGAHFDHSAVAMGTCIQCHNGSTAPGKPASGHPVTTGSCDSCHLTTSWRPAKFNHANVAPGTCQQCHGVTATGKPAGHVVTTASCDACHNTNAWIPASFDHSSVAPGSCNQCHSADRPAGHFVETVNRSCDVCHSTSAWTPLHDYSHTSAYFPGRHNSSVTCNDCHNNTEIISWPNPADKAFCGGCHKADYRSDPHTKYGSVTYTYDELKDCTGSCHIYTDSTLSTISQSRTGHHHPGDGSWDQ